MSERVPPNDMAAERAVLGGVLLENAALDIVLEIGLSASDFYSDAHGKIFSAIAELHSGGAPVDSVTLRERLETAGKLVAVGGDDYLLGLTDAIPTIANIEAHAKIVREKSVVRGVITACNEVLARGYGDYGTADEFMDGVESVIGKATDGRAIAGELHHVSAVVDEVYADVRGRSASESGAAGAKTGFEDIDRYIAGLEDGLLYIIAGRPGSGKTAFTLNVLRNVAESEGKPAVFFSLEMPKAQLGARLLASEALVDGGKLREARLGVADWPRLATAAGTLSDLPIYVDDTPGHDVDDICRIARRKCREDGLSVVCVDYLQLVTSSGKRLDNREQEISYISRTLKGLAKELEIPVIALSQLNRGLESRGDKRPVISDLRESGAIEQDADTILFIYRDEVYNPGSADRGLAEIIIGKQRGGATGTVKTVFRKEYTRFESYDGHHEQPQQSLQDSTGNRYG